MCAFACDARAFIAILSSPTRKATKLILSAFAIFDGTGMVKFLVNELPAEVFPEIVSPRISVIDALKT
jgi:hypothetical protein